MRQPEIMEGSISEARRQPETEGPSSEAVSRTEGPALCACRAETERSVITIQHEQQAQPRIHVSDLDHDGAHNDSEPDRDTRRHPIMVCDCCDGGLVNSP